MAATQEPSAHPPVAKPESDAVPREWLEIFAIILFTCVTARLLAAASAIASFVAVPLALLYLSASCPSNDSFDARRELKRVLRGDALPENHPDKPKGFFSKVVSNVSAAIETTAATGLGYTVEMIDVVGVFRVAIVRSPTLKKDYYWLGAINRWRFLYEREHPSEAVQEGRRQRLAPVRPIRRR